MGKRARRYWLMKSEPSVYSLSDLQRDGREPWDGVRSYQARNYMRDMCTDDLVLFYHSNTKPPGVAGVAKVACDAYPDATQFDTSSHYFDPKSSKENPRWSLVDVAFVERFDKEVPLQMLREDPELAEMVVIQKGCRLSVQPVEKNHFQHVLKLGHAKTRVR